MESSILEVAEDLTAYLPRIALPVPCKRAPSMRLNVYIDSELGLPLGLREPKTEEQFLDMINPGDSVVDVGAHIGLYSILALSVPDTNVHIFEGHPTNVHRLLNNLHRNGVEDRAAVYSMYSWSAPTTLQIDSCEDGFQVSVSDDSRLFTGGHPLDECLANKQVNVIKIDVEGVAGDVLDGAHEILSERDPVCLIEVHSENERRAVNDRLNEHGYSIDKSISGNWVATPPEDS